jgi:hypothetical protein
LLAGSAGPAVGVKAVAITEAVHVVAPPRWSVTVTIPSEPEMVPAFVEATCVPRDTPATGALIDKAPAVRVNEAGVAPPTDVVPVMVTTTASAQTAPQMRKNFRMATQASSREWPEIPLVALIAVGLRLSSIQRYYTRQ